MNVIYRNNDRIIDELKETLRETEIRIEKIDYRLEKEKLTTAKFLQIYAEKHCLMIRRRNALRKLKNAKAGRNPWGDAIDEAII